METTSTLHRPSKRGKGAQARKPLPNAKRNVPTSKVYPQQGSAAPQNQLVKSSSSCSSGLRGS